jgi:uncharacterized surface protein with fasciclin (FAS1) repeats
MVAFQPGCPFFVQKVLLQKAFTVHPMLNAVVTRTGQRSGAGHPTTALNDGGTIMLLNLFNRYAIALGLALALALGVPAQANDNPNAKRFKPGNDTIAEIAIANGNFNTLVTALLCTDLVGAVADPEAELTVFAPTDAAFAAAGLDKDNICGAFDKETLSTILLYHVVGERRPSPSVINGRNKSIEMLAGGSISPEGQGGLMLYANNSMGSIAIPDILASNGIIHVIDFVLLP